MVTYLRLSDDVIDVIFLSEEDGVGSNSSRIRFFMDLVLSGPQWSTLIQVLLDQHCFQNWVLLGPPALVSRTIWIRTYLCKQT